MSVEFELGLKGEKGKREKGRGARRGVLPFPLFPFSPLALLLCLSAIAAPLSFDDAVKAMKAKNEAVMAAQDDINQRDAEREAAKGLKLPKAELDMKYVFLDDPVMIGINATLFDVQKQSKATVQHDVVKVQMTGENFAKGEVKVTQPLYAGGRIKAANSAAAARRADAVAQKSTTEDQLVTELAQRYYGLCLARRNEQVQSLKADTMKQQAYKAKRLMEEGIIARVEYLNADVALANATTEWEAAKRDVAIVSEGLSNILVATELPDPTSPLFVADDIEPCETFQGFVNEDHPILKMLAAKHDLAHQGVKAEEGNDKPTVYLFGMHELFPGMLSQQDPRWAVGMGVQYNLFDGFQVNHKVTAAKSVEEKVGHLTQKAQRDLKSLVLKRYQEMMKAREQFQSFDKTLELTKENLRVRTRAFEEGMATSLEVVDATLSHARAQLGRFKAAFDFDYALFQLLEASGRTSNYQEYLARTMPVAAEVN